ncbi:MAG: hypothetical protein ACAH17_03410, partial [Candidatus Paceibacterota bacterium]
MDYKLAFWVLLVGFLVILFILWGSRNSFKFLYECATEREKRLKNIGLSVECALRGNLAGYVARIRVKETGELGPAL